MGGVQTQALGYTADGRMGSFNPGIQVPNSQYITSLSYNQDGQMSAVNAAGGTLASYTYDGFGQRILKTISSTSGEIYQYGQTGILLEETNQSGVTQADYIYLNGRPIAVLNGPTLYYLHDDRLGTPQLATDGNQTVAWQASYDPFGQASVSGTITQNLRSPGQYFDLESGWNHNGFRDYAPTLGRYIEPDPLGRLGSGNDLYAYVGDNPIDFIDPLGLRCGCESQSAQQQNVEVAQEEAPESPEVAEQEREQNALEPIKPGETQQDLAKMGNVYDAMHPGPLPDDIAKTFSGGEYVEVTVGKDGLGIDNARVYGGKAGPLGRNGTFFSTEPQVGGLQSAIDYGLRPEYGNTTGNTVCAYIPAGTTVYIGQAANQGGAWVAGKIQIYVPPAP